MKIDRRNGEVEFRFGAWRFVFFLRSWFPVMWGRWSYKSHDLEIYGIDLRILTVFAEYDRLYADTHDYF